MTAAQTRGGTGGGNDPVPPRHHRNRSRAAGTAAEAAVVRYLRDHGWPGAERRALRGRDDAGDIAGTPLICWEVKGGNAARQASDQQILAWLNETERERVNANAEIGILVLQRSGVGPANVGRWWAVITTRGIGLILDDPPVVEDAPNVPIRLLLGGAVALLRYAGYGDTVHIEADKVVPAT